MGDIDVDDPGACESDAKSKAAPDFSNVYVILSGYSTFTLYASSLSLATSRVTGLLDSIQSFMIRCCLQ